MPNAVEAIEKLNRISKDIQEMKDGVVKRLEVLEAKQKEIDDKKIEDDEKNEDEEKKEGDDFDFS